MDRLETWLENKWLRSWVIFPLINVFLLTVPSSYLITVKLWVRNRKRCSKTSGRKDSLYGRWIKMVWLAGGQVQVSTLLLHFHLKHRSTFHNHLHQKLLGMGWGAHMLLRGLLPWDCFIHQTCLQLGHLNPHGSDNVLQLSHPDVSLALLLPPLNINPSLGLPLMRTAPSPKPPLLDRDPQVHRFGEDRGNVLKLPQGSRGDVWFTIVLPSGGMLIPHTIFLWALQCIKFYDAVKTYIWCFALIFYPRRPDLYNFHVALLFGILVLDLVVCNAFKDLYLNAGEPMMTWCKENKIQLALILIRIVMWNHFTRPWWILYNWIRISVGLLPNKFDHISFHCLLSLSP